MAHVNLHQQRIVDVDLEAGQLARRIHRAALFQLRHLAEAQARAKVSKARGDMAVVCAALRAYFADHNCYPPNNPELREFLIQCGIALTAVSGFAFGKYHFSKWSRIFAAAFVLLYAFWMLSGYPQVDTSANVYWVIIPARYTWDMIYVVNRGTKVLMFLTYLFFYSGAPMSAQVPSNEAATAPNN